MFKCRKVITLDDSRWFSLPHESPMCSFTLLDIPQNSFVFVIKTQNRLCVRAHLWLMSSAAPTFQYVRALLVHFWCYTCCTYISVCTSRSGSSLVLHLLHLCFSMYALFRFISGATPAAPMFQYV